jgi:simple sugar transport system permease protein
MWETIKATPDYQSVFMINALIGASVLLLIVELRRDALRVLLTVGVALVFGYLMTALFNLDAAARLTRGEFRVRVISDAEPLTSINYEDRLTAEFNNPQAETPLQEISYRFAGSAGNRVSILAFAADENSSLDLRVALLDAGGAALQEGLNATQPQMRAFRRYLNSELDAVIEDFTLPGDGIYTITASPEPASAEVRGEFTVALLSDDPPPVNIAYNGDPVGEAFNAENADKPLKQASYRFAGRQGDTVTILAYAFRPVDELNLQVSLRDAAGHEIGVSDDSSQEQVAAYSRELKTTKDAIIENVVLPADGVYAVAIQPEPLNATTQIKEMVSATNKAYNAFLLGPLENLNRWILWIRDALTLVMAGLAIAIVFRAEQFSLGAEGQIYFGALVSGVIGLSFGGVPRALLVPIALLSAATAGFLWGLVPGALKAYLGANELVSTLMLNTIATRFYEMVLNWQLKPPEAGYLVSDEIGTNGLLHPIIDVGGDQVSIAVYLVIGMALLTWVLIQRTPLGYEIRMIGTNIKFASYGGVNTKRTIMLTMAISGAVAGLAGAHLAMGIHRKLIVGISSGLAFEGVVVALLARNNPLVVPFAGFLYAYLRTGAQMMERDTNVSAEVVRIIQAVVILLITAEALVTFFQRRRLRRRGTVGLDMGGPPGALAPAEGGAHG